MDTALISVVIPCYNQAHFLTEAIASVAAQRYRHFELIVVDDGSTDATEEVARRYPWVQCLGQENRGLAGARNTGLHASSGEYIVFLDADDRLLPEALRAGKEALDANPSSAFAFGAYRKITEDGRVLPERRARSRFNPEDPFRSFLEGNHAGMHSNVMYRRAAVLEAGGFQPTYGCEDYDLFLRLARSHSVVEHAVMIAEYRQHEHSMSRNTRLMFTTTLKVLRSQWEHVRDNRAYRRAYRRGLRRWRDYYGERLLHTCSISLRQRRWAEAWHALQTFVRLAGSRVPMVIALYCLPFRLRTSLRERLQCSTPAS